MAQFKNLLKPKNSDFFLNSKDTGIRSDFFTPNAKLAFIKLRYEAFIKILIFHYFDLKYNIQIEINVFGYAVSGV